MPTGRPSCSWSRWHRAGELQVTVKYVWLILLLESVLVLPCSCTPSQHICSCSVQRTLVMCILAHSVKLCFVAVCSHRGLWLGGICMDPKQAQAVTTVVMLTFFPDLCLSLCVCLHRGLWLGGICMDPKQAQTVTTVVMLTFLLVGGFYVRDVPVWIGWVKYFSFIYWVSSMFVSSDLLCVCSVWDASARRARGRAHQLTSDYWWL